jgi:hypothetical protein
MKSPGKISLPPPTPGASTPPRTGAAGLGEHPHTVKRIEHLLWQRITTVVHGRRRRRSSPSLTVLWRLGEVVEVEGSPTYGFYRPRRSPTRGSIQRNPQGLLRATARAGCGVRVRGMIMTAWSHQQVTE